jgi:hypothetical protein
MAPGPGDVDENKLPQKFAEAALPQFSGSVSQQCNGYDCGPYMILFMRKFLLAMSAQPSYAEIFAALNGESLPEGSSLPQGFLRKNWVTAEEAALQRPRITLLILEHLRDALLQTRATTEEGMTYEDHGSWPDRDFVYFTGRWCHGWGHDAPGCFCPPPPASFGLFNGGPSTSSSLWSSSIII